MKSGSIDEYLYFSLRLLQPKINVVLLEKLTEVLSNQISRVFKIAFDLNFMSYRIDKFELTSLL